VYQISRQSIIFCVLQQLSYLDEKKGKKKLEQTKAIIKGSYLGNASRDLVEIWNVR